MNQGLLTARVEPWSAIVQARMNSSRLPEKTLVDLCGKPVIAHVVDRLRFCGPERIVLAIPDKTSDDPLAEWASKNGVDCARGSEDDVLGRILMASKRCSSEIFIRATADNPFVEPEIVHDTLQALMFENADYAVMEGAPLGTTVEAMTCTAVVKLDKLASSDDEREHLSVALWNNPDSFNIKLIEAPDYFRCENLRLTIDTERDLRLARILYNALAGDLRMITLREIIKYVKHNPLVKHINAGIEQHLETWLKERKSRMQRASGLNIKMAVEDEMENTGYLS